jgi:hypothetical protein
MAFTRQAHDRRSLMLRVRNVFGDAFGNEKIHHALNANTNATSNGIIGVIGLRHERNISHDRAAITFSYRAGLSLCAADRNPGDLRIIARSPPVAECPAWKNTFEKGVNETTRGHYGEFAIRTFPPGAFPGTADLQMIRSRRHHTRHRRNPRSSVRRRVAEKICLPLE